MLCFLGIECGECWLTFTKLDMPPDSWLKRYLNTTQHAYWITQPLTRQSRTKWELFCWRFFKMHFFVWRLLYCDLNFTEVYPKVPINDKSTPDNITLTKYGIISLFKRWRLYFFVNLVKEYSPALFQCHPFENRDAFMNLCPRLCVRNVVK